MIISESRRLRGEFVDLISPNIPSRAFLATEHLQSRPLAVGFNPLPCLLRFAGMLPPGLDNEFPDIAAEALGRPFTTKKAKLRVLARGMSHPGEKVALGHPKRTLALAL